MEKRVFLESTTRPVQRKADKEKERVFFFARDSVNIVPKFKLVCLLFIQLF